MLDSRGGNLEEFFRHESSPYPPALSTEGSINSCTKSDLLRCIMETSTAGDEDVTAPDMYDFITIDGGMLIHSLPGTSVHGKSNDVKTMAIEEMAHITSIGSSGRSKCYKEVVIESQEFNKLRGWIERPVQGQPTITLQARVVPSDYARFGYR